MSKRDKRWFAVCLGAAVALLIFGPLALAQGSTNGHSSRPVTIVVPFPAGGGPDLAARILADKLQTQSGQTVVIENRPGASSMIGVGAVARAAPDGHTLLFTTITTAIAPHVLAQDANAPTDVFKDLVPVVAPATTPMVLVAHPRLGVKTVKELIALAKANPGVTYGSAGFGSGTHFAGEMFKRATGIDLLHVPYRGVAPSIIGTVRGDTSLLFVALGASLSQIQEGKLIPLALTEHSRSDLLPDVPTVSEQGFPGVEIHAWYGIFAPVGTPATELQRINREINAALKMDDVRQKFRAAGVAVLGGDADRLAGLVKSDSERYGAIARNLNIRIK